MVKKETRGPEMLRRLEKMSKQQHDKNHRFSKEKKAKSSERMDYELGNDEKQSEFTCDGSYTKLRVVPYSKTMAKFDSCSLPLKIEVTSLKGKKIMSPFNINGIIYDIHGIYAPRVALDCKCMFDNPIPGVTISINPPASPRIWAVTMTGKTGTPYAGGLFDCRFAMHSEYPFEVPHFQFLTPIFHANVTEDGCLDIRQEIEARAGYMVGGGWTRALRARDVLKAVYDLIDDPACIAEWRHKERPYLAYERDFLGADRIAHRWTRDYAGATTHVIHYRNFEGWLFMNNREGAYFPDDLNHGDGQWVRNQLLAQERFGTLNFD